LTCGDVGYHGHTLAVAIKAFKIMVAQHAWRLDTKTKTPGLVTMHWISDVYGQTSEAYDLQQGFPIALLITAEHPCALVQDITAGSVTERYLANTEMSSDTSHGAIKCCSTNYPHRGLFNGKEKPRIF
jgi:hypothetical protein